MGAPRAAGRRRRLRGRARRALCRRALRALALNAGYVSKRHVLPPATLAFGYAAVGVPVLGGALVAVARRLGRAGDPGPAPRALALGLGLALLLAFALGKQLRREGDDTSGLQREAAEWLRAQTLAQGPAKGPVAADKVRVAYYAGAPFVSLRDARSPLLPWLRERGALRHHRHQGARGGARALRWCGKARADPRGGVGPRRGAGLRGSLRRRVDGSSREPELMLYRYSEILRSLVLLADLTLVAASWMAAYWLRFHVGFEAPRGVPDFAPYAALLVVILPMWIQLYRARGLYEPSAPARCSARRAPSCAPTAPACCSSSRSRSSCAATSTRAPLIGLFFALSSVSVIGLRIVVRLALRQLRRHGYNLRYVIVVGAGEARGGGDRPSALASRGRPARGRGVLRRSCQEGPLRARRAGGRGLRRGEGLPALAAPRPGAARNAPRRLAPPREDPDRCSTTRW
ncbi:MAG: hypothetical protein MZW92_53120 [Comamonadaceae bacterium]|nr:hypothetical protein [Comamonadaceae bacterium]